MNKTTKILVFDIRDTVVFSMAGCTTSTTRDYIWKRILPIPVATIGNFALYDALQEIEKR